MTITAETGTGTGTAHRNVHTTDTLQAIYDHTVDFVANEVVPNGSAWEEAGMVPREVLRQMGSLGMFGLRVPEELGGLGLGMLASATFAEALGTSTYGGFEATVLVHTDMALPHLLNSGTPEQLERWLPPVLAGETILAIGVTEPDAGSDVAGLRTTAVRDGDGWRINGRKTFITNAVYGDLVIVAARTDANERYGISMFLVPTDTPGFAVASKLDKHGWLCSDTAELTLDDVWVDNHQLLGTEHRGFHETMRNFQDERMVLIGMAVGASQTALDLTTAYCSERKAFGGHLSDLGAIRQRLAMRQAEVDAVRASMYHAAWMGDAGQDNVRAMSGLKAFGAEVDAVRASMYHAAWMGDSGQDNVRAMSGLKAFGAEVANRVMYDCLQFHGGMGYMRESTIERMTRDARILPIGGGATEVLLEEVAKRSFN